MARYAASIRRLVTVDPLRNNVWWCRLAAKLSCFFNVTRSHCVSVGIAAQEEVCLQSAHTHNCWGTSRCSFFRESACFEPRLEQHLGYLIFADFLLQTSFVLVACCARRDLAEGGGLRALLSAKAVWWLYRLLVNQPLLFRNLYIRQTCVCTHTFARI